MEETSPQDPEPAPETPDAPPPLPSLPELPADTPEPIAALWELFQAQPLLGALVVIALFFCLGKVAQWIVARGVRRLTRHINTDLDDRMLDQLERPIFISVFFFGLIVAALLLDPHPTLLRATLAVLKTVLVIYWMVAGLRLSRLSLEAFGRNRQRFSWLEERTLPLFDITTKLLIVGAASYAALLTWNIDPTAWLASAGIIGIAVGFAAKDTLANLFAGFFIIADAPYRLGDFIILETGERGQVTHVGLRSTRLLTRDDIEIILPNAMMANSKILNESGGPWRKERMRIKVGVAYGSDVDQVCEVLSQIAAGHEHICPEPKPRVRLRALGESSLDFELLCWISEPMLRGQLSHELLMEIYKTFSRLGIEIPYPKREVYLHRVDPDPSELESPKEQEA